MKVVCTEASQVLGAKIASFLEVEIAEATFRRFPDGELYLRTGILDDETVIVGSLVDSDSLVQLLLLIDACADSASTLVVPYLGYARQDKQFSPGEPVSARAVAKALSRGVEEFYTVNVHEESVLRFFDVPARSLSLAEDIGAFIGTMGLADPLILAPDKGAAVFAGAVASVGGWDSDDLKKTRISGEEVRIEPRSLEISGRDAVIVDDIISTGATIATAAGMLMDQQAEAVHAICVHGVFTEGAYARLSHAGLATITASDTIERGCSMISAARRIGTAIKARYEMY